MAEDGDITCTNLSGTLTGLKGGVSVDDICMAACDKGVFFIGDTLEGLAPTGSERTDTFFLEKGSAAFEAFDKTLSRGPVFTPAALCANGWLYAFGVSQFEDMPVFGRAAKIEASSEPVYTPKKGETLVSGNYAYTVLSSSAVSVKLSAAGKKSLAVAKIPATVKLGSKTFKVTGIDASGFASAKALKSVSGAVNVNKIGSRAFANCKKLATFTLSSASLAKIGASAFTGCAKLKTLTIAKTAKLTKAGVKNSLKGSSVKTVDVKKSKVATYKKYFKKANSGRAVTVK